VRIIERVSARLQPEKRQRREIENFHRLYYESPRQTWQNTRWLGVSAFKTPLDLWVYQELLVEVQPALIVETGTALGGSAYFLATICDLLGRGEVVTIDIEPRVDRPPHPRVTYIVGSSTAPATVDAVSKLAAGKSPVMVFLDSDHSRDHVLAELRHYSELVTPGSYLVVEDTNVNGHPVLPDFGPGPMEALQDFLGERPDFAPDVAQEKFLLTFNPRGYLRRTA